MGDMGKIATAMRDASHRHKARVSDKREEAAERHFPTAEAKAAEASMSLIKIAAEEREENARHHAADLADDIRRDPFSPENVARMQEAQRRDQLPTIGEPGVRPHRDGSGAVTVQMAKRSEQLEGIADTLAQMMGNGKASEGITLTPQEARRLWGYAQTIGTVADELKRAGK